MAYFYDKDGNVISKVLSKKGTMRNVTIRDARKHGYFPSVTQVIKEGLPTPTALIKYFKEQVVWACLDNPKMENETRYEYAQRVIERSYLHSDTAKDFGNVMHNLIERYINEQTIFISKYDKNIRDSMYKTSRWIEDNKLKGHTEKIIIDRIFGYGGKPDFHGKSTNGNVVVDFKTQNTKDGKFIFYDEWKYQISAYIGILEFDYKGICLAISSNEPGLIEEKIYTDEEIQEGWKVFSNALENYKIIKKL
ncbi:MAG: hypothetical protein JSW06_02860 [Thermoplasmatales archaeon]|nr:MAG: hypothetical protein JSW06_02860 [Thermoplasmatales archaeon]